MVNTPYTYVEHGGSPGYMISMAYLLFANKALNGAVEPMGSMSGILLLEVDLIFAFQGCSLFV